MVDAKKLSKVAAQIERLNAHLERQRKASRIALQGLAKILSSASMSPAEARRELAKLSLAIGRVL